MSGPDAPYTLCADADAIAAAVERLAGAIAGVFETPPVTLVVLEGARRFADDLTAALPWKTPPVPLTARSYRGAASRGTVELDMADVPPLAGRDVLLIDDILDSGLTLRAVCERIRADGPSSLRTCVLLRKRRAEPPAMEANFVGLDIEDRFVVGYGLDLDGRCRDLPFIAYLDAAEPA